MIRGPRRGALRCTACQELRDLSWLVLPRNITPTDVDGLFVIHNRDDDSHLFLEFKRPEEAFAPAQKEALEALSRKPRQDVLLVTGTPANPVACRWCHGGAWYRETPTNRLRLNRVIKKWVVKALERAA